MKKIFLIIAISFLLVSCAYKPLINPETSKDPATGENIAGNYWSRSRESNPLPNRWQR